MGETPRPLPTPVSASTPAASGLPALSINLDSLSRVAGLSALIGALLTGAGMLYTYAYLSAWGISPPLVKLDPLSAALRAEGIAYQVLLLVAGHYVVAVALRWKPRLQLLRAVALAAISLVVAILTVESVLAGFFGGTIAVLGGGLLAVARHANRLSRGSLLGLAGLLVLLSSYLTGTEIGRATRDDVAWQRPLEFATDVAVGDLPARAAPDGGWHYEGLYLIFRDDRQLYLGVAGASEAWLVDADRVLSLRISGSPKR